jgi:hypothetical protein
MKIWLKIDLCVKLKLWMPPNNVIEKLEKLQAFRYTFNKNDVEIINFEIERRCKLWYMFVDFMWCVT